MFTKLYFFNSSLHEWEEHKKPQNLPCFQSTRVRKKLNIHLPWKITSTFRVCARQKQKKKRIRRKEILHNVLSSHFFCLKVFLLMVNGIFLNWTYFSHAKKCYWFLVIVITWHKHNKPKNPENEIQISAQFSVRWHFSRQTKGKLENVLHLSTI